MQGLDWWTNEYKQRQLEIYKSMYPEKFKNDHPVTSSEPAEKSSKDT